MRKARSRKDAGSTLASYAGGVSPLRTVYFAMLTFALCAHALFGSLADDHAGLYRLVLGHGPSPLSSVLLLGVLVIALFTARFEGRVAVDPKGGDLVLVSIGWLVCLAILVAVAMLSSKTIGVDAGFGATHSVTLRPGLHSVLSIAVIFGGIDAVATILHLRGARLRQAMARESAEAPPSEHAAR